MRLSREEREELRRRVDEEKRKRVRRGGLGTQSLAATCYQQANGDPLLALWLAIRFIQRHPKYLEEQLPPAKPQAPRSEREQRNEAIRAMRGQGYTLREIAEEFGLTTAGVSYVLRPWAKS